MNKFAILLLGVAVATATPVTRLRADRPQTRDGSLLQELEDVGCFTMVDLVIKAGLTELLTGPEIHTLFAPTDAAFAALDQATLDALLNDNALLLQVLNYHLVAGNITSAQLVNDVTVPTLEGTVIRTNIYGSVATINGAPISVADEWADNGMVHVVDKVLTIPAGDIAAVLSADAEGRFSTLLTAVGVAGLGEALAGGPFTLFAPTNAAFAALPEGVLDSLLADPQALAQVLLGHLAPQTVFAAGVATGNLPAVVGSFDIVASADGVTVDGANVVQTDLVATNGVVHVIDAVI